MSYEITITNNDYVFLESHIVHDGSIELRNVLQRPQKFEIPAIAGDTIYVCYKRFSKWAIRESVVKEVIFTNIPNLRIDNGFCIHDFRTIFTRLEDAQEFCYQKNKYCSIKIHKQR